MSDNSSQIGLEPKIKGGWQQAGQGMAGCVPGAKPALRECKGLKFMEREDWGGHKWAELGLRVSQHATNVDITAPCLGY